MTYNVEPIWYLKDHTETGINKIPNGKLIFVVSSGCTYQKISNAGLNGDTTLGDAIDAGTSFIQTSIPFFKPNTFYRVNTLVVFDGAIYKKINSTNTTLNVLNKNEWEKIGLGEEYQNVVNSSMTVNKLLATNYGGF
jgi:hypothetical protein